MLIFDLVVRSNCSRINSLVVLSVLRDAASATSGQLSLHTLSLKSLGFDRVVVSVVFGHTSSFITLTTVIPYNTSELNGAHFDQFRCFHSHRGNFDSTFAQQILS